MCIQSTIKDLFEEPSGLDSLVKDKEEAISVAISAPPAAEVEKGKEGSRLSRARASRERARAAAQTELEWKRITAAGVAGEGKDKGELTEAQMEQVCDPWFTCVCVSTVLCAVKVTCGAHLKTPSNTAQ